MRPRAAIVLLLVVAAAIVLYPRPASRTVPGTLDARIVRLVDGDTLVAAAGGRSFYVRLLGIDTPETHRPGTPVECGGPEASASMRALAPPGARVRLEWDPTQDRVDRYGRMLAYVWLADGRLLEAAQLESGWATTYVYAGRPVRLFRRLATAALTGQRAHRGVWARCGGRFHSVAR